MHSASLKSNVNQLHIFAYAEGGSMQFLTIRRAGLVMQLYIYANNVRA